jgi:hypothetical protein
MRKTKLEEIAMNIQILDLANPLWLQTLATLKHDVYHLPEYIHLEAQRTQSIPEAVLIQEEEKIFFLPYLLRRCDEIFDSHLTIPEIFDVVSPYGYPGLLLNQAACGAPEFLNQALQQLKTVFLTKNVCSVFLRLHPILNYYVQEFLQEKDYQIQGETVSIDLTLSETDIWQKTRSAHRTHINRCKRAGFIAKIVDYHEYLDDFMNIYYQTMDRVVAKEFFYFKKEYFVGLSNLQDKIHLCIVELEKKIVCAAIFTECCEIVQYHLGGTSNKFLKLAPNKLMIDYMRFWAKNRGNKVLHLGGGVGSSKDSLYHFKAGFSQQRYPFMSMRLIINEPQYIELVKLAAKCLNLETEALFNASFFPAYRALL